MATKITTSPDLFQGAALIHVFADGLPVGTCRPIADVIEAHKAADGTRRRFTRPEAAYSWLADRAPTPKADRPTESAQVSLW